jgi:hypothetical protein
MLGIKTAVSAKSVVLMLVFILIITLLINKNSQSLMRFMVGQEINLKTADFNQYQSEHYDIKYTPVDEPYVKLIAGSAEEAYDTVSAMFGLEPGSRTVIVVYPDSNSLSQSFGWDKDANAMGVYWAGSIRILSPREWLGEQDMSLHFTREGPMVHEFAHLMVDEMSRGNYNRWLTLSMRTSSDCLTACMARCLMRLSLEIASSSFFPGILLNCFFSTLLVLSLPYTFSKFCTWILEIIISYHLTIVSMVYFRRKNKGA